MASVIINTFFKIENEVLDLFGQLMVEFLVKRYDVMIHMNKTFNNNI